MKVLKTYKQLFENNDIPDTLKSKLLLAEVEEDNDADIRTIIGIEGYEYDYELESSELTYFGENTLKIIMHQSQASDYLELELNDLSYFLEYNKDYITIEENEIEVDEIKYQLNNDNLKVLQEIFKKFNCELRNSVDFKINTFFNLKIFNNISEEIRNNISMMITTSKEKSANTESDKLDFYFEYDSGSGIINIIFDLDDLDVDKKNVNEIIQKQIKTFYIHDFNWSYDIDPDAKKDMNISIHTILTDLLSDIEENDDYLEDELSLNEDMKSLIELGGDFKDYVEENQTAIFLHLVNDEDTAEENEERQIHFYKLLKTEGIVNEISNKKFGSKITSRDFNL